MVSMGQTIEILAQHDCQKEHDYSPIPCTKHEHYARLRVYDQIIRAYEHFPMSEIERRINLCPDCLQFDDYHESDCTNVMAGNGV